MACVGGQAQKKEKEKKKKQPNMSDLPKPFVPFLFAENVTEVKTDSAHFLFF